MGRIIFYYRLISFSLISIFLITQSKCNKEKYGEPPEPDWPLLAAHSPVWSPDGSQIIFVFAPVEKIDDNLYQYVGDSGGLWIIKPDGSDLKMFLHYIYGPKPTDWHPVRQEVIGCMYDHHSVVKINLVDTTITDIGYLSGGAGVAHYNSSGTKIAVAGEHLNSQGIWIMDTNGTNIHLEVKQAGSFDWSPDNKKFCFWYSDTLFISDTSGANRRKIISSAGTWSPPSFSPDGKKITFCMRTEPYPDDYKIYVINVDGTNLKKLATGRCPAWSPDGNKIVYVEYSYSGNYEEGVGQLWIMNANGTNKKQLTFIRERRK